MTPTRRHALVILAAAPLGGFATGAFAQKAEIWSAAEAHEALLADRLRLLDIRSRDEWLETGVASGAWPVSMHERGFPDRLFTTRDMAGDRPVGLICATGGRSAAVLRALRKGGYTGYVDISEGMLGSRAGRGWIAAGLPVVSAQTALAALPPALA